MRDAPGFGSGGSFEVSRLVETVPLGEDTYVVDVSIGRKSTRRLVHEKPDAARFYVHSPEPQPWLSTVV